jgi:RNA polymerase sigma-70 factor (ECF subfamily)
VLAVIYFVFNEGYVSSAGTELGRADLVNEAVRLARHLVELMPDEHEALGLLALLLLIEARRPARTAPDGTLVPLGEQDRSRWDTALIEEGQALVRRCLVANQPGPYQIQAAINAVHADARRAEETAWDQIVTLYDQLLAFTPTPVVALNRAVAVAELGSPSEALALVEALELESYYLFHAVRGDLLARVGRLAEAASAYERAAALTANRAELRLIERRRNELLARARVLAH